MNKLQKHVWAFDFGKGSPGEPPATIPSPYSLGRGIKGEVSVPLHSRSQLSTTAEPRTAFTRAKSRRSKFLIQ